MSDTYLPNLMELDSYWQKAVEDAIRDTVKGEEKLHRALRNRKKINQKLKTFGLKPVLSRLQSSRKKPVEESSAEEVGSESDSEESIDQNHAKNSRSKSEDTHFEDEKQKSPTRSVFGNGSVDKIKRSQNSFNCEPMGGEGISEEGSETEQDRGDIVANVCRKNPERNKNIQWLHVRNDRDFGKSDSESTWDGDDGVGSVRLVKHPFHNALACRQNAEGNSKAEQPESKEQHLKRKLHLALAKRDILNKKLKTSDSRKSKSKSKTVIKVSRSAAKNAETRTSSKKQLSSFVKFYLDVYGELCHKMPVKRIAEEAAKRWRVMSSKEKANWSDERR